PTLRSSDLAAEQNNDDPARKDRHASSLLHDVRFASRGKNETLTRSRSAACFHAIDPLRAKKFVSVTQRVTLLLASAPKSDLAFLLRNVKAKARLVQRVAGQPSEIFRG